jgi:two-component system response regulator YesN
MYKLLIADDEEIIRHALQKLVNWQALGFEVSGVFEDGQDLIDYLETKEADVILSDIRMFQTSGLEVARYVYEKKLDTMVCLFSGYEDFNYAREAIKYGVCGYILKPFKPQELIQKFKDIRKDLDQRAPPAFIYLSGEDWHDVKVHIEKTAYFIMTHDFAALDAALKHLFSELSAERENIIHFALFMLFERVLDLARDEGLALEQEQSLTGMLQELHNANQDQLADLTKEVVHRVIDLIDNLRFQHNTLLVDRLTAFIKAHISETISLDTLAQVFNFNPSYLSRRFKTETGCTLSEYINRIRLEQAMLLLRTTDQTMRQIATAVGYHNEKYFCRCFKNYTGCTTQEYKRKA